MIREKAFAKINLNLHLLPQKSDNGFYPVRFINTQINLYDEMFFKRINKKIKIICDHPDAPLEKENLVYKAANLIKKIPGNNKLGVEIKIDKKIPVKSGFGGGSSDAAVSINVLSKLWQIKLTEKQKKEIAGKLGKDVFYFLKGGLCEVTGDSSLVKIINHQLPTIWLIIIVPKKKKPSTGWMYKNLNIKEIGRNLDKYLALKRAIISQDKKQILNNLFNDFETTAVKNFPFIDKIKKDLIKSGALISLLAGSGLSVVGFFDNKSDSLKAWNQLKIVYQNVLWTKTK